jgi:NAD(P)-dependent dehydrogenase (short-subunit alcohol dehydrogenase family)
VSTPIPDQTGRTAVITGGGGGIGLATAAALSAAGARVILAVRDEARARAVADRLVEGVSIRALELGSLASIRTFADSIEGPVYLLVNNAGTMSGTRHTTSDGFELQLGVNHLGHFALTNLLLPQITGRVVTITSSAHASAKIDFDDLQWERRTYRPFGAYGQSKLANLLFTAELQRRLVAVASPAIATAAHPGWASTGFTITSGNRFMDALSAVATRLLAQGPEAGALPTLHAAVGDVPGGSLVGPRYFGVRGAPALARPAGAATDPELAERLWEVSERLTGTRFPLAA